MKQMEEILDILVLKRQGFSNREIARRMGVHRNTVSVRGQLKCATLGHLKVYHL